MLVDWILFDLLQTTRSPNLFEISPRPFAVTTSPVQNRGQFSSFGQPSARQNGFGYNFPPSAQPAQRQNPYLDTTGFGEVIITLFLLAHTDWHSFSVTQPHNALIIFSATLLQLNGKAQIERYKRNLFSFCAT